MSWDRPFDDPVPGCASLREAAEYILSLPKDEQELPHWQAAVEALTLAAEGRGPMIHARIGMLKAMNFGKPAPTKPRKAVKAFRILR